MKKVIVNDIKFKNGASSIDVTLSGDGNLYKDDAKILDTDNAAFADLRDVNIPSQLTPSDNNKIIKVNYDTAEYVLGPKVTTTLDDTTDLEVPTSKAVADYNLSSNMELSSYIENEINNYIHSYVQNDSELSGNKDIITSIVPSSLSSFINLNGTEAQYSLLSANMNYYVSNTETGKCKHVVTQIYSNGSYDANFDSDWNWIGQAPDNNKVEAVNGDKFTLDILAFGEDIYAALGLPANVLNRLAVNTIDVSSYTILSSDVQKVLDIIYDGNVNIYVPSGVCSQYDEFILNRITSGAVAVNNVDTYLNGIFEGSTTIVDGYAMVTMRCYEPNYFQIIGNFSTIA